MTAKIILFILFAIAALALYSGLKKIFSIFSLKGGCGCSKTGASECHCHENREEGNALGIILH